MSAAGKNSDAGTEWRRHWPVVLVGVLGMALSTVHIYSAGLFIGPLEAEFGWSRAEITFGFTLLTLIGASVAPFVGALIDYFGPRRLALVGIACYCLFLAALSLATSNLYSWWGLWLCLAIGGMLTKPTMWTAAVSSLFSSGRGLALAVTLCGTGVSSTFIPLLSNELIEQFGWRGAYIGLGVFCAIVVLPVAFFCLTSATDNQRLSQHGNVTPADTKPLPGFKAREAILSWRFFKLAVAAFTVTLAIVSFVMNLVPIVDSLGLPRDRAATIAGAVGISSILGRLVTGYLLDRFNGNVIGGLVVLTPIFSSLCFLLTPDSVAMIVLAVIVLGLALGAELDVIAYLATRHFGMRSYGVIFGTIVSIWSIANGLGPLAVSYVYDVTGGYVIALWAFIPLLIITSAALFSMGEYPVFADDKNHPAAEATAAPLLQKA